MSTLNSNLYAQKQNYFVTQGTIFFIVHTTFLLFCKAATKYNLILIRFCRYKCTIYIKCQGSIHKGCFWHLSTTTLYIHTLVHTYNTVRKNASIYTILLIENFFIEGLFFIWKYGLLSTLPTNFLVSKGLILYLVFCPKTIP